ncbi:helix-turn-helix domain-containing protein [Phenylobacterium sp.]|jgi:AraC-like DNA-binding protein/mannose-6-phosphate isomerase-like protein (cupin superfamily)|uniref:AraC-like ligand-binding domain-containing protein n=1 Tax=Phenylobacterium sp. TaxID=1871053 RepID=UPI002F3F2315
MQHTVSTAEAPPPERLDYWQDVVCRTFFRADCRAPEPRSFHGEIATVLTPPMAFSRLRSTAQTVRRDARQVRQTEDEVFLVNLQVSGTGGFVQDGREVLLQPGDFTCSDSTRPCEMTYEGEFEQLVFYMPRSPVARALGGTSHLTAAPVRGASAVGALVSTYLHDLGSQVAALPPATAERLAEVGQALVLTALGEMSGLKAHAHEWGRPALRQRALHQIEINARDPQFGSVELAAVVGVSPRYLQDLFRDLGETPSGCIWKRRLHVAARDLVDPRLAEAGVGQIAFACGFSDVAHFSRRFRAAFGLAPRDYRADGRVPDHLDA